MWRARPIMPPERCQLLSYNILDFGNADASLPIDPMPLLAFCHRVIFPSPPRRPPYFSGTCRS